MKRLAALLPLFAGCLSVSQPAEPKTWTVDAARSVPHAPLQQKYKATRLGAVTVMMPYDRSTFSVRRADGSLVEDPFNRFAASPASLLRSPTLAALAKDGRFGTVVNQNSVASASATVELTISNLSLDCREKDSRRAVASLRVDVVSSGPHGPREVVMSASGSGSADASSGDYTAAFTSAFDEALQNALAELKDSSPSDFR